MKILIIGQAPPAVTQQLPYDTTMLYDWLHECGISKDLARCMFTFESVYNKFTGYDDKGGHLIPTKDQMDAYWESDLELQVQSHNKIWVLGNVARNYLETKDKTWSCNTEFLYTIHPSKRNFSLYLKNKLSILANIKLFIYGR